jgi:hypothetical protein
MFPHSPAVYEVREFERRELLAAADRARLVASDAGRPGNSGRRLMAALHVRSLRYALGAIATVASGRGPN